MSHKEILYDIAAEVIQRHYKHWESRWRHSVGPCRKDRQIIIGVLSKCRQGSIQSRSSSLPAGGGMWWTTSKTSSSSKQSYTTVMQSPRMPRRCLPKNCWHVVRFCVEKLGRNLIIVIDSLICAMKLSSCNSMSAQIRIRPLDELRQVCRLRVADTVHGCWG